VMVFATVMPKFFLYLVATNSFIANLKLGFPLILKCTNYRSFNFVNNYLPTRFCLCTDIDPDPKVQYRYVTDTVHVQLSVRFI